MSESGAYETANSVVDGTPRIIGYRAVPGLPLVVAVSYARSEALAPWYRHLMTFGLLVVAIDQGHFGALRSQPRHAGAANAAAAAGYDRRFTFQSHHVSLGC